MSADIRELNKACIKKRTEEGFALLQEKYSLKPLDTGSFKNLHIANMDYTISQYEIENVGNLLIMLCPDSLQMQMDSFVLSPYYKDLPLFSSDYMYIGEKRMFLNELYSLVCNNDERYAQYIKGFTANKDKLSHLTDMPVKACWYDDIRPVCSAKLTKPENDEEIITHFLDNIKLWIKMEQELPMLNAEEQKQKKALIQDYTDKLVDSGGVSTDVFKKELGAEATKKFFNEVFFAPARY